MSSRDSVLRVERDRNYSHINLTVVAQDARLSWKAKGLHTYLVTRPDGWEFNRADLIRRATDQRDSVLGGLRELEEAGYLDRIQDRDEQGRLGRQRWIIREVPLERDDSGSGDAASGKSGCGQPAISSKREEVVAERKEGGEESRVRTREAAGSEAEAEVPAVDAVVEAVMRDWRELTGRRAGLTFTRTRKIQAAIRGGYSTQELKLAVRGALANTFFAVDNPHFLFPETLFRDEGTIERHIAHARRSCAPEPWWPAPAAAPSTPTPPHPRTPEQALDSVRMGELSWLTGTG